jgi:hypothetical protein
MPLAFISSRVFAEVSGVTPLAQILHQDDLAFGQPPHEAIELLFSGLDFAGFRLVVTATLISMGKTHYKIERLMIQSPAPPDAVIREQYAIEIMRLWGVLPRIQPPAS